MFNYRTKAELVTYSTSPKAVDGIHTVIKDESFFNEKIEYELNNKVLKQLSNPKIEFLKLDDVETKASINTTYTTPINKNMVVVLKDETQENKTTWYTYNVDKWVLMGEYFGSKIQKVVSPSETRLEVINKLTDYTIPNDFKYTVGRKELSVYLNGSKLTSDDFTELGTPGTLSNKIQFSRSIMITSELQFVREVSTNITIDPTFQIPKKDVVEESIFRARVQKLENMGYSYGGILQECKVRDYSKVYYCKVNKKFYRPKFKSIVPTMTANTTGAVVASASSEHVAPFPAYYAFDNSTDTFWHNTDNGQLISPTNKIWIKIDLGVKKEITEMLLAPRKEFYSQMPADFVIEGSDDNVNWVTLKTVTNAEFLKAGSFKENQDIIPVKANNRYYRLTISRTMGTSILNSSSVVSSDNCTSIRSWGIGNSPEGSWTIADSDWAEVLFENSQSIDWVPTINLLGNVSYNVRNGKIIKTDYGFKINFHLVFTCDNITQDSNFFEISGLPFFNGFYVNNILTENVISPGTNTPTGVFAMIAGSGQSQTDKINLCAELMTAARGTQYWRMSRNLYKGSTGYICGSIDVIDI